MEKIWLKSYPKGVPAEIDGSLYSSIVDLIESSFKKFKELPAFENMGAQLSFAELDAKSRDFAAYLQKSLYMKKGDRVAVMMPNILQYPVVMYGILRAGLTVVNINPLYTSRELKHQLIDSGAETIVIVANFAGVLQEIISTTSVKNIVITEIGDLMGFPKSLLINFVIKYIKKMVPSYNIPESVSFNKALGIGKKSSLQRVTINGDDIAFLQYTGGTTGVSKGAMLTHSNIIANVMQIRYWINANVTEKEEIVITPLPLYHIFSLSGNCLTFTLLGCLNVLITNPRDIPGFIKELKKHKFTVITGVNTLFNALVNNDDFKGVNFDSLRLTVAGGMAVQKRVVEKWKEITGKMMIEAYGLTETSPGACMNPMNIEKFNGCAGLPISSTDISLRDDNGAEVKKGEVGELCIKGPQVMKGYWKRKDETDLVLSENGWLKTGDMAIVDKDGYVKIVDRKKDMILVSGFNVYPNEVEDVVIEHNGVYEVAAIGMSDHKSGEVVKLFVVKKDKNLTEDDLMVYCKENLTGYKRPKKIVFLDEMPKTNVGKILRRELKEI